MSRGFVGVIGPRDSLMTAVRFVAENSVMRPREVVLVEPETNASCSGMKLRPKVRFGGLGDHFLCREPFLAKHFLRRGIRGRARAL